VRAAAIVVVAVAALAGCSQVGRAEDPSAVKVESRASRSQMTFIEVEHNPKRGYLIDPLTRSCTLVYELYAATPSAVAVPVDCAVLASTDPQAAVHITWTAAPARWITPAEPPPAPPAP
jgi:hypothetical protein